nr:hypothetical protein CH553_03045 [Haemophilus influenzae]
MKAFLHHLQNKVKLIISLIYCVDGGLRLTKHRVSLLWSGLTSCSSDDCNVDSIRKITQEY